MMKKTNGNAMRRFYIFIVMNLIITLIIAGIFFREKDRPTSEISVTETTSQTPAKKDRIDILPFINETGWGYTISIKGKPYIRQNTIPVIEGNKGFASREKALKAGEFVAYKIRHSIMPPTVSRQELDSLQVLDGCSDQ